MPRVVIVFLIQMALSIITKIWLELSCKAANIVPNVGVIERLVQGGSREIMSYRKLLPDKGGSLTAPKFWWYSDT